MRLTAPISREKPFCIHSKHGTIKRTVQCPSVYFKFDKDRPSRCLFQFSYLYTSLAKLNRTVIAILFQSAKL